MSDATFDTLGAARDLEAAGIERRQAEAIAEGMRRAVGADRAALATKADLVDFATKADLVDFATKADLVDLRAATRADLETLRSELRWMLAFQAALILAIAAKLFGIV